jgi:hypothetical protein
VRVAITPAAAGSPRRRDSGRRAAIGTVTEVLLKGRCGDCG